MVDDDDVEGVDDEDDLVFFLDFDDLPDFDELPDLSFLLDLEELFLDFFEMGSVHIKTKSYFKELLSSKFHKVVNTGDICTVYMKYRNQKIETSLVELYNNS